MPLAAGIVLALAVAGCSDDDAAEGAASAPASKPACHQIQILPDGSCCGPGTFVDTTTSDCVPFGPPECAAVLPEEPSACVPRWCVDWHTSAGVDCAVEADGCLPAGRRCSADELAASEGCDAGHFAGADGSCHLAGHAITPPQGMPAMEGDVLPKLPPTEPPRWCLAADGKTGPCSGDAKGCPAGHEPDPKESETCRPLAGVDWLCPKGFVVDKSPSTDKEALPRCLPDPADCGSDVFGGVQPGAGVFFVDAAAKTPGQGTHSAPWTSLATAIDKSPSGSTIAVAAGKYIAGVSVHNKVLTIRGRCAQKVVIQGMGSATTLQWTGKASSGSSLRGLTILGPNKALTVEQEATVLIERCLVQHARSVALRTRKGAVLTARDVVVADTGALLSPKSPENLHHFGRAISIEQTSKVVIERLRAYGNREMAIGVFASGVLEGSELVVDSTRVNKATGRAGWGLAIFNSAHVTLDRVRLHRNRGRGIMLSDPGSKLSASRLVVEHTRSTSAPELGTIMGRGLDLQKGATLKIELGRFSHNRDSGIIVFDAKSTIVLSDLLVEHTLPEELVQKLGRGIDLENTGDVTLRRVWLRDNQDAGLFVYGDTARVTAEDLLVEGTMPIAANAKHGRGINVQNDPKMSGQTGPRLKLARVRLSANHDIGLAAFGAGIRVEATDLVVDGTITAIGSMAGGRGVEIGDHAWLDLRRAWLHGNQSAGLRAAGAKATIHGRDVLISGGMAADAGSKFGRGLVVFDGALATLHRARVTRVVDIGMLIQEKAWLWASDVSVDRTWPRPHGRLGRGVDVSDDSSATLVGVRVLDNRELGAGVKDGVLKLVGALVAGTKAQKLDNLLGFGLLSEHIHKKDGRMDVISSVVRANRTVGALANRGHWSMKGTVIGGTLPAVLVDVQADAGGEIMADGIIVQEAALSATEVVVCDNLRAGIVMTANTSVKLSRAAITGNTWGVVGANDGEFEHEATALWMNSLSNTVGDMTLKLPQPPPTDRTVAHGPIGNHTVRFLVSGARCASTPGGRAAGTDPPVRPHRPR